LTICRFVHLTAINLGLKVQWIGLGGAIASAGTHGIARATRPANGTQVRPLVNEQYANSGSSNSSFFLLHRGYSVGMKRCTVSVIDGDGEPHQVAVNATSLFDCVDRAIEAVVAVVVVQRRRCGGGSGRKLVLAGTASARYFIARWKGHAGSVRLEFFHPTTDHWDRVHIG
jgi:hypothetical protein